MITVKEARTRIASFTMEVKVLRGEINFLNRFIRKQNGDPETLLSARNNAIYIAWKEGKSIKQLSEDYTLAKGTIYGICKRIETNMNSKRTNQ